MDITRFIWTKRSDALLIGDYGSYRRQLSRRLLTIRRKLGRSTPKGRKYAPKAPVSVEDIQSNPEFIHLILLTSERAWAQAMAMKSMHATDSSSKAMTGSTRTHVISRLNRAKQSAWHLLGLVRQLEEQQRHSKPVLEAKAYYCMMLGSKAFESQLWEECLQAYSEAHVLYSTLSKLVPGTQGSTFSELLTNTIQPSVRYAAYQLQIPRTFSVDKVVSKFASSDSDDVKMVLEMNPDALSEGVATTKSEISNGAIDQAKTISWRKRTVNIEDANIAQALAAVSNAEKELTSLLSEALDSKKKAMVYEVILGPSQDAVDSTKTAIDELLTEGLGQDDARIQALQITRTAVGYALVGWRIGRNRILCGQDDGIDVQPAVMKRRNQKGEEIKSKRQSREGTLARLREQVALYDSTLQSLESVGELPGIAADTELLRELQAKRSYFAALRCLAIARSHAILNQRRNCLALLDRAYSLSLQVEGLESKNKDQPPNLEVSADQVTALQKVLRGTLAQQRAMVELEALQDGQARVEKQKESYRPPLLERLDEYPVGGADLSNLVIYPPQLRPIPVKPIFLDLAWNYIEYPGRASEVTDQHDVNDSTTSKSTSKEGRKGWGFFGR